MICNICQGTKFTYGPGVRLSHSKKFPSCCTCHSLERHRAVRFYFDQIRFKVPLNTLNALHFAPDKSVVSTWFKDYERSVFGGNNSIDLCNIDRPDCSYDMIICNHVLEHIKEDRKAVKELARIIKKEGVVIITVPSPVRYIHTIDWGVPDSTKHGHFRVYGSDVFDLFTEFFVSVFALPIKDPVTEDVVIIHILFSSHGKHPLQKIEEKKFFESDSKKKSKESE